MKIIAFLFYIIKSDSMKKYSKKSISILFMFCLLGFINTAFADNFVKMGEPGLAGKTDPGKALLYIMRPASFSGLNRTWAFVDDQCLGVTKGKTYFYTYVTPGKHLLWSAAENINSGYLNVEAGKTYYFKQGISMGWTKVSVEFLLATEAQGKEWIKNLSYVTTTPEGMSKGKEMGKKKYADAKAKAKDALEHTSD